MSEPGRAETLQREGVREATLAGVRWAAVGRAVVDVATLGSSIVLARLMPPSEFGAFAIALVVGTLALALAAQGFAAPLVQRESVDRGHLEVATLLSLLSGTALSALVYLSAPLASPLFGDRVVELVRIAAPMFLLAALGVVANARLQRRLDFRRTVVIEIAATLMGVVATLGLALAGLDAEALVIGVLVKAGASSVMLLAAVSPVVPRWNRRAARDIAAFGSQAALTTVGYTGFRNVDYAILGAQLGTAQVGFFWRAYHVCFDYQQRITSVMQRVAFPVLSRSRDLGDMRELRYRIVRVHGVVLFPVLFMIVATAPVLIPWLYGEQWEPAVTPVQILGVAALTVPLVAGTGPLILAAGKPRDLMITTWAYAIVYALVVFVASPYGIEAVCYAILGFELCKFLFIYRYLLHRLIGISLAQVWRETAPGLVAGLALLATAVGSTSWLDSTGAPQVITLVCSALLGTGFYLLVLRTAFATAWADLRLLVTRVLRRSDRRAGPRRPAAWLRRRSARAEV